MGQTHLTAALVDGLVADTTLVTLTGHTTANLRIGMDGPIVAERTPFLGVKVIASPPLMPGGDVTQLQNARVQFKCSARAQETAVAIADEVEALLHNSAGSANTGFWDVSDGTVRVRQARYANRVGPEYDGDQKVWTIVVEAQLVWLDQAC